MQLWVLVCRRLILLMMKRHGFAFENPKRHRSYHNFEIESWALCSVYATTIPQNAQQKHIPPDSSAILVLICSWIKSFSNKIIMAIVVLMSLCVCLCEQPFTSNFTACSTLGTSAMNNGINIDSLHICNIKLFVCISCIFYRIGYHRTISYMRMFCAYAQCSRFRERVQCEWVRMRCQRNEQPLHICM